MDKELCVEVCACCEFPVVLRRHDGFLTGHAASHMNRGLSIPWDEFMRCCNEDEWPMFPFREAYEKGYVSPEVMRKFGFQRHPQCSIWMKPEERLDEVALDFHMLTLPA